MKLKHLKSTLKKNIFILKINIRIGSLCDAFICINCLEIKKFGDSVSFFFKLATALVGCNA